MLGCVFACVNENVNGLTDERPIEVGGVRHTSAEDEVLKSSPPLFLLPPHLLLTSCPWKGISGALVEALEVTASRLVTESATAACPGCIMTMFLLNTNCGYLAAQIPIPY